MKNDTIKTKWLEYVSAVMPEQCGTTQYNESRKCFYAGCVAMLQIMHDSPDSEQGVEALLDGIHQELGIFKDGLIAEATNG